MCGGGYMTLASHSRHTRNTLATHSQHIRNTLVSVDAECQHMSNTSLSGGGYMTFTEQHIAEWRRIHDFSNTLATHSQHTRNTFATH
jgi:hypothetical protein